MRGVFMLVLVLAVTVSGCDEDVSSEVCSVLGVCEDPAPAAEEYVIVLDASPGSTADAASVAAVLDRVLERAVDRPASSIVVFVVGTDAEDSREIFRVEVPEPPRRVRSPRAHRSETIAQLRRTLTGPISERVAQVVEQRRSAIADTLTLAARSFTGSGRRWLVIVGDLREMSLPQGLDMECPQHLPDASRFQRNLRHRGLLQEEALSGIEVVHVDLGLPAFPRRRRCDLSLRRADELFALWRDQLRAAGAPCVVRQFGGLRFENCPSDETTAR